MHGGSGREVLTQPILCKEVLLLLPNPVLCCVVKGYKAYGYARVCTGMQAYSKGWCYAVSYAVPRSMHISTQSGHQSVARIDHRVVVCSVQTTCKR